MHQYKLGIKSYYTVQRKQIYYSYRVSEGNSFNY
jgi:hypothetical protein